MITQNHIIELLALVTGIIYWPFLKFSKLFWLPFFLAFIVLVELTGRFLPQYLNLDNAIIYNFSIPLEYLFYSYLFYLHGNYRLSFFSKISATIIISVSLISFILIPISIFHHYVLMTGQILIIVCCCLYIYEQFLDTESISLIKNYFFWIVAGLLLFNLGDFSYTLLFPLIRDQKWDDLGLLFKSVNNSFLFLLYLSYIIAIVTCKRYSNTNG